MITSNSTNQEIMKQMAQDEANIQEASRNWMAREHNNLVKTFRVKKYFTPPQRPMTYHSHTTDIHWRVLFVLMHKRRPSSLHRAQGMSFGVESENTIKYTIVNDMDTAQPLLVLTYPDHAFFVSAHAVRRYRERCLENKAISFEDTCDALVRRSPSYTYYFSHSVYGTTDHTTIVFIVANGIFLGYYDKDKAIYHLETFISDDILNDEQKHEPAYVHNKETLIRQRDMVLGKTPFDEQISASMLRCFVSMCEDKGWKQLTDKEVEELVKLVKEEVAAIPEEERERKLQALQDENRHRYSNKMKRKGYV